MRSKLKERFERLAPIQGVDRVRSGSHADVLLRPAGSLGKVRSIDATAALARGGRSLLRAKRTIESLIDKGEVAVRIPTLESVSTLAAELRNAGVSMARIAATVVEVKAVRLAMGLTQEQFALRFGLELDVVQNWEQGRTQPDKPSAAYLRAIAADPDGVAKSQEEAV